MAKAKRIRPSDPAMWGDEHRDRDGFAVPTFSGPIAAALYESRMKQDFAEWEKERKATLKRIAEGREKTRATRARNQRRIMAERAAAKADEEGGPDETEW